MTPLESLMRDVAAAQREVVARQKVDDELERRLQLEVAKGAGARPAARRSWLSIGALSLSACAVTAALFLSWKLFPTATNRGWSTTAPAASPAADGRRVCVTPSASCHWSFPGGSEVQLAPGSEVQLGSASADGSQVRLQLVEGEVAVHVVHQEGTAWTIAAGGREVHVVGTRFRQGWNEATQTFWVDMQEGTVEVSGRGLPEPVRLTAGESLRTQGDELGHAAKAETVSGPRDTEAPVAPKERAARSTSADAGRRWDVLAREGDFRRAMKVALRAEAFQRTERLDANTLVLLGDVARINGASARAEAVYQEAVRRFPEADAATFALGLLAFHTHGDFARAAKYFSLYLSRYPHGSLSSEAAGRRVEAEARAGHVEAARTAARFYLSHYPTGPHARLAAQTLGDAKTP